MIKFEIKKIVKIKHFKIIKSKINLNKENQV